MLKNRIDKPIERASGVIQRLDAGGDAHSATDAERDEAAPRVAPPQRVHQSDEHSGTAGADGVSESDRAAAHVDPLVPLLWR